MHIDSLRVLLTVRDLSARAGTQLYTLDVAEELRNLGHTPVVYAPRLGAVAAELRERAVAVVDDLDRVAAPPDVIHGQHHTEAMAAMLRFPRVPALYVCHGWLPWVEAPPRFPSLARYLAVDALRRDRLVLEHGIPEERVTILHNFVDLERFQPRPPLPPRPRRALLLSNQATPWSLAPAVEKACAASGLQLTVAGAHFGSASRQPAELLPEFDLVFARGRSALEAMAVGAAVVLCDVEGCGPLVDLAGYQALRDLNFGIGTLRAPVDAAHLRAAIAAYDPAEAVRVRDRVRAEAGRKQAVARLVEIYRSLAAATTPGVESEEYARSCLAAASKYVSWLAPAVADFEDRLRASESRLAATAATLEVLERSPFFRLRARLLSLPPVAAAWRALKARFN